MNTKSENQSFSAIFKSIRKFYGLQQSEMASLLEVTQGWISKIESGNLLPDIMIWHKFTKKFFITDPYCFTYGGVEIKNEALQDKLKEKSSIIKGQTFDKSNQFLTVRKIRPLIDIFENNYTKQFEDFLKKNSIPAEFFVILNHPLNYDIVDLIFKFMKDIKISEKTLNHLSLNFKRVNGQDNDSFKMEDLFNESSDNLEYTLKKGEYSVCFDKETLSKLSTFESADLIIHYNLLFPYFYFRDSSQVKTKLPIIKQSKNAGEWTVKYAA